MKKRILITTLSLLLMLSSSACGIQSAAGTGAEQNTPSDPAAGSSGTGNVPVQNTPDGIGTNYGTGMDLSSLLDIDNSSFSFSSLTEFYNSEFRTMLEDTTNEMIAEPLGLHYFITIEEPETLIYNYQYTNPLSSIGISHEEAAAIIASNFQEMSTSAQIDYLVSSIKTFQLYGLPVKVIRMTYLDTDGSIIYSADVTEDTAISVLPGTSDTAAATYASLQEWADSEEADSVIETTNRSLSSVGITFDLAVDGNLLVYKYYLPDKSWTSDLTEEELTASFDSMTESLAASVDTIFTTFTDTYGLTVSAVRFIYYSAGGTELYSKDFLP